MSDTPSSSVDQSGPFRSGRFFLTKKRPNDKHKHACNEAPPSLMIVSIAQTLEGQETCPGLSGTVESG